MTERSPSPGELIHYGVVGMKWGKRKKATAKDIYTARARLMKDGAAVPKQDSDRIIAARMTRGEKVVSVLLTGPIGLTAIAATSGVSRRIEYKQDKNRDK